MKSIFIGLVLLGGTVVAVAGPSEDMVTAGKEVVKTTNACYDYMKANGRADKVLCGMNTMAARKAYNEARLKVTVDSPATRQIEQEVQSSMIKMMALIFK